MLAYLGHTAFKPHRTRFVAKPETLALARKVVVGDAQAAETFYHKPASAAAGFASTTMRRPGTVGSGGGGGGGGGWEGNARVSWEGEGEGEGQRRDQTRGTSTLGAAAAATIGSSTMGLTRPVSRARTSHGPRIRRFVMDAEPILDED